MSTASHKLSTSFNVFRMQGDLEELLSKTSAAKKTVAAMVNFFEERAHLESKYSKRLFALSRSDPLIKRSLKTYKSTEQTTFRAVCDVLLHTSAQEAELHHQFSESLTNLITKPLNQLLLTLRTHKKSWMERIAVNIKEMKLAESEVGKGKSRSESALKEMERLSGKGDRKSAGKMQDLVRDT